eukprot:526817_1
MAIESWYVANECIPSDELQPIWLITIGFCIQMLIAYVIKFNAKFKADDQSTANRDMDEPDIEMEVVKAAKINNSESTKSSFCKRLLGPIKIILKAWSICSIILVNVFDIFDMIDWIQNHQQLSGWDHFMCMGCIIAISSNFKKYLLAFAVFGNSESRSGSIEFLKTVIVLLLSLNGFFWTPWFLLLWIPSIFVAGWCVVVLVCGGTILFCYWESDDDEKQTGVVRHSAYYLGVVMVVIAVFAVFALMQSFALVTINIYSGINYWESFRLTFEERKTTEYISYSLLNTKSKMKFLTWLF